MSGIGIPTSYSLKTFRTNNKNIYGENLVIHINQFIRDEIKFSSPEELVKQINIDISKVKNK